MYEASVEARKATAAAISSDRAERPTGVAAPAASSSSVEDAVATHPGATTFTVTPCRATSSAQPRVRPTIPALPAPYGPDPGSATTCPVTDPTITTRP